MGRVCSEHRTQAKCKQKGCTNTPTPGFSFCKRCYQSFKEKQKEMKTSGTSRKLTQDDKEDYIKGFTLMLKSFLETSPNLHVLDSGCNRTCITDPMIFDNLSKPDLKNMVQADGSKLKVEAMGPITMHFESGFIQIPDALYVPNMDSNLISVDHLIKNGCNFHFGKTSYMTLPDQVTVRIESKAGLPMICATFGTLSKNGVCKKAATADTWHSRFGHLSPDVLKRTQHSVKGLHVIGDLHKICNCAACSLAVPKS